MAWAFRGSEQQRASWVMGVPRFSWMQSHIPWWEAEVRRDMRGYGPLNTGRRTHCPYRIGHERVNR